MTDFYLFVVRKARSHSLLAGLHHLWFPNSHSHRPNRCLYKHRNRLNLICLDIFLLHFWLNLRYNILFWLHFEPHRSLPHSHNEAVNLPHRLELALIAVKQPQQKPLNFIEFLCFLVDRLKVIA
jgi:hypothetical protein